MKTQYILLIAGLFIIYSCDETNITPDSSSSIISNWEEISTSGGSQFEGSLFTILNLHADSTYQLTYRTWSDIAIFGDPCHRVNTYYSKGRFTINNDYLKFNGCCADSTCMECQARCDGQTDYSNDYVYNVQKDTLKLSPIDNPAEVKILVKQYK